MPAEPSAQARVELKAEQLLIVAGSTLRAEEADRPLAYYLRQRIESSLTPDPSASGPSRVLVVADFRWIHDDALKELPTISVGGPGVNALAHRWLEEIPVTLAVDEEYYIQMDPDPEADAPRASIWGMDNTSTQIAVSVFVDRFLPRFLQHCAKDRARPADQDDTA